MAMVKMGVIVMVVAAEVMMEGVMVMVMVMTAMIMLGNG